MSHPNIVEIFDIGEFTEDGAVKPYFVIAAAAWRDAGPFDPHFQPTAHGRALRRDHFANLPRVACRARAWSGAPRLKPSNIFVMPDDTVKSSISAGAHGRSHRHYDRRGRNAPLHGSEQLEMKQPRRSRTFFRWAWFLRDVDAARPSTIHRTGDANAIVHLVPPAVSELNPR